MRWVLEYRLDENENKKPTARILILGFLDPDYENRPAASPTMTEKHQTAFVAVRRMEGFSIAKVCRV